MEVATASEINRIVIGSEDPAGLARFYQHAFGMEIAHESDSRVTLADGRTQLLLLASGGKIPVGFHCLGFRLIDEAKMLQRASELGASVSRVADWEHPGKNQYLFRDPDGNLLALFANAV